MSSVAKSQGGIVGAAVLETNVHACRPFYLNILLLNKAEIVAQKVGLYLLVLSKRIMPFCCEHCKIYNEYLGIWSIMLNHLVK